MELSETLLWFFVILPYSIAFHSLPQDGRPSEKSPVNNRLQAK